MRSKTHVQIMSCLRHGNEEKPLCDHQDFCTENLESTSLTLQGGVFGMSIQLAFRHSGLVEQL